MADMLQTGSAWLSALRDAHAAQSVTYKRDSAEIAVSATPGKTVFRLTDDMGYAVRVESRDWIVLAADLVIGGSVVLPARGDQVRHTVGTTVHVYEVMAPGGEPHYKPVDGYQQAFRVHTSEIDQEDA